MIKRFLGSARLVAPVLIALGIAGCDAGDGPVPVTGRIMFDGQPLSGASISFVPDGSGRQATGFTDAEGVFSLSTVDPKDGAMPGKYKVIIQPSTPPAEVVVAASADEAMVAGAKAAAAKPKGKAAGSEFPSVYARLDQTILSQEIPAKGEVVFDLKSTATAAK